MDVQRGEDGVMVIVLDGGKLLAQQADVVIVDEGDCAHHVGGRRFPRLFDQFLADQVAKGFGAVGVSAPPNQFIELLQEGAVDGDANPAQIAHASIIVSPAVDSALCQWHKAPPCASERSSDLLWWGTL